MNFFSKIFMLPVMFLLIVLCGCKNGSKSDNTSTTTETTEITDNPAESEDMFLNGDKADSDKGYCFLSKTPAANSPSHFNYQLKRFWITEGNQVEGYFLIAFYQKDSSRGHFSGTLEDGIIKGTETILAEGDISKFDRSYTVNDTHLQLGYKDLNGEDAKLDKVSCDEFEAAYKQYQQMVLSNQINTTDRARLNKVAALESLGFDKSQIETLSFQEVQVDLDGDYKTQEYLLYIIDRNLCGSGGCTLFVIDGNSKIISQTSVVKLPIYTTISTAEDKAKSGTWQPLFVWSDGSFRKLSYSNNTYDTNASMVDKIDELELQGHPEKYRLLLDYQD